MDVSGPENVSSAAKQPDISSAQLHNSAYSGLRIESQLPGTNEIANARNFFTPKVDIQSITAPLASVEHSSAVAMKAASNAISPMLQIIMRMPGHIGIFSSFLECLKNLFMPHDLLANFNPAGIASGIDLTHSGSLSHLGHLSPLSHQPGIDLSGFPSLHAFHNISGEIANGTSGAHLHMNAFDSLKQSANVSAGADINNPQFEGVTAAQQTSSMSGQFSGHGDALAGPGISAQAITPKLSPAERIFSPKLFESGTTGHFGNNSLLASNNQVNSSAPQSSSSTASNTSNLSQEGQNPTHLSGLHAKAYSLNDILHNKVHMPHCTAAKHVTNPFANMASKSKLAFQSAQMEKPSFSSHAFNAHSQPAHKFLSSSESNSHLGTALTGHSQGSLANYYTVKSGDSLWKISQNVLGGGEKWTQLYKLNNGTIGANPNMIFSGQKLALAGPGSDVLQPQHHVQSVEQLAHHQPSSHHAIAHVHEQPAHHASTANHAAPTLAHNSAQTEAHTVAHNPTHVESHTIAHNAVKQSQPVIAEAKMPTASQQSHFHGLAVDKSSEQILSGSGGAQAATNNQTSTNASALNKAATSNIVSKSKSVVSFSLAPDLSFLDGQK